MQHRRPLVVPTLAFTVGVASQDVLPVPSAAWAFFGACLAASALAGRTPAFVAALCLLACSAAGGARAYRALDPIEVVRPFATGDPLPIRAAIGSPVENAANGDRVASGWWEDARVGGTTAPVGAPVRLRLPGDGPEVHAGDRLAGVGKARLPASAGVPGEKDRATETRRRGQGPVLRVLPGFAVEHGPECRAGGWREQYRTSVRDWITAERFGDPAGYLLAITVGDRSRIDEADSAAFLRAGVTHLISISGLHVAGWALATGLLVRGLFDLAGRRWPGLVDAVPRETVAGVAAIPPVVAYALVAGPGVPVVRSAITVVLVCLAAASGRTADAVQVLAVSAWIVLLHDPRALWDPSFQLSYASVAGLLLVLPRLPGFEGGSRSRVGRWLALPALGSVAATLATGPIVAAHFGSVSASGVLANPPAILLLGTLSVPPALVACGLLPLLPVPAEWIMRVAGLPVAAGLTFVRWIGGPDGAPPVPVNPDAATLAASACIGLAGLLLPARAWPARIGSLALAGILAVGLPTTPPPGPQLTFLSVGQGDATLVELPGGERFLVDAGGGPQDGDPGPRLITRHLARRRIRHLDELVVTHPHLDHYGGAAAVLEAVHVTRLRLPTEPPVGSPLYDLAALARSRGAGVVVAERGVPLEAPRAGGRIATLHPLPGWRNRLAPGPLSVNDLSVVLRLDLPEGSVLLTGDAEEPVEDLLVSGPEPLAASVVKVPHHGSATSSTPDFVRATGARWAVAQTGRENRFGFPRPSVRARWRAAGTRLLATGDVGTVAVCLDRAGVAVSRFGPVGGWHDLDGVCRPGERGGWKAPR